MLGFQPNTNKNNQIERNATENNKHNQLQLMEAGTSGLAEKRPLVTISKPKISNQISNFQKFEEIPENHRNHDFPKNLVLYF